MVLKILAPDWFRLNGPKHISLYFFIIPSYFQQRTVSGRNFSWKLVIGQNFLWKPGIGQNFPTEDRDWSEFIKACDWSEFFIEGCDWSELKTVTPWVSPFPLDPWRERYVDTIPGMAPSTEREGGSPAKTLQNFPHVFFESCDCFDVFYSPFTLCTLNFLKVFPELDIWFESVFSKTSILKWVEYYVLENYT